jgi:glyoxylase-like metal-dependent hydrolase (beta-lactamase superfamily II)
MPSESWRRRTPSKARTCELEDARAVVAGDTLVDFGEGVEIPAVWLREGVTRDQVVEGLRPLLELPVEHVLPTHGGPTDRAALQRALS